VSDGGENGGCFAEKGACYDGSDGEREGPIRDIRPTATGRRIADRGMARKVDRARG
jgi:hypothetical protein